MSPREILNIQERPTLSSYSLHLAVFENAPRLVALETRNPFSVRAIREYLSPSKINKIQDGGAKGWKDRKDGRGEWIFFF